MGVTVGEVVLPGDHIEEIRLQEKCPIAVMVGPGLRVHLNKVFATKSGILMKKERRGSSPMYYVECLHQKRYVPICGETVLGVVTAKQGDIFKVDIGSSEQAFVSYLGFENSTKKNRPDVQVGDVIFAVLIMASRDMEAEVVCVDSYGKKGRLGVVSPGGFLFTCSLNLIRKILRPDCPLLLLLGKVQTYEIVIGMNGKVYVNSPSVKETIAICNAILAAEHKTNEEIKEICEEILEMVANNAS